MKKQAYLIKLTDADSDVCAFLVDKDTIQNMDNDRAVEIPWTNDVLDGNNESYTREYAQTKDIIDIIKNAENNGYFVDLNNE